MSIQQSVCRVCLDGNVTMYCINTELRDLYEILALTKLDGRPKTLCYICYSQLKRCCQFAKLCKESEQILITLVNSGYELTNQTVDMVDYGNGMKKKYSINVLSPTVLPPPQFQEEVQVKREVIHVEENSFIEDHKVYSLEEIEQSSDQGDLEDNSIYLNKTDQDVCSKINVTEIKLEEQCDKNLNQNFVVLVEDNQIYIGVKGISEVKDIQIDEKDSNMLIEKEICIEGKENLAREEIVIVNNNHNQNRKKTNYVCSNCSETFTNKKKLVIHLRTHAIKPIKSVVDLYCNKCSKRFTKRSTFSQHKRNHLKERTHACHICHKSFIKDNLNRHMKIHTGERPFACNICCKTFNQKVHVKGHIMRVHTLNNPSRYTSFGQTSLLKLNLQAQTRVKKEKTELSAICKRIKKERTEKPICDYCNKTFLDKSGITRHIKIHTGERPFVCNICDKGYVQRSNLNKHMITHFKEKNTTQVCHICGKIFSKRRLLSMHLKIHNRNHFCFVCNKAFPSNSILNIHMTKHTKEKPHACKLCDKKFSLKTTLHVHLRTHTGEKPYTCHDCGKTFSQKICLIKHTRVHTGIKPFACDQCDRRFTQKNGLMHHLKTHRVK